MLCGKIMVVPMQGGQYLLENPATDEKITMSRDEIQTLARFVIEEQ
jgi:hypothetical protein